MLETQSLKIQIQEDDQHLSFGEVIDRWRSDEEFILFYNAILANVPYDAFFWEHPALSFRSQDEDYEFVVIPSKTLSQVQANLKDFEEHFQRDQLVTSFSNLGGDATLIVPTPLLNPNCYTHLAAFCRNAPENQVIAFWKKVGKQVSQAIDSRKRWLSTSGLGVYWLHVRIDAFPKYYQYQPYK